MLIIPTLNPRFVLLALILLLYSSSTVAWTVFDRTPPPWDPSDHFRVAYDYYHRLSCGEFYEFITDFFCGRHRYAPLFHLLTAFAFLLFGVSRSAAIAANLFSLAVLLVSVEWMTRRIYGGGTDHAGTGRPVGFAPGDRRTYQLTMASFSTALLAASYHFPAWLMNYAFLDYALMAITAAALALLVRAGDFRVRLYAIQFGIVAGLGLLTKQTFPLFLVLPGLYVALKVLRAPDKGAILNLSIGIATAIGIGAIWYIPHLYDVVEIFEINRQAAVAENEAPVFSLMSNIHYLNGLVGFQIQTPFAILFVFGLLYSFLRRRKESVILYLWILGGIAAFTLLPNKDLRYTVPILPAVALVSLSWMGTWVFEYRGRDQVSLPTSHSRCAVDRNSVRAKWVVTTAITAWSLISFMNAQWPVGTDSSCIHSPPLKWTVLGGNCYQFDHRPLDSDWSLSAILYAVSDSWERFSELESHAPTDDTEGLASRNGDRPRLGVTVNLPYLNPSGVALYSRLLADGKNQRPLVSVEWIVTEAMLDRVYECDYLLVRTGLETAEAVSPVENGVERLVQSCPERFIRIESFRLPQGDSEAVVYRLTQ